MTKTTSTKRMLTKGDLAELIGCCKATVVRLAKSGELPAPIKLGNMLRWDSDAFMAWLESKRLAA
jgi:excisionase family DNA binding protein